MRTAACWPLFAGIYWLLSYIALVVGVVFLIYVDFRVGVVRRRAEIELVHRRSALAGARKGAFSPRFSVRRELRPDCAGWACRWAG